MNALTESQAALKSEVLANLMPGSAAKLRRISHGRFDEHLDNICREVAGRGPDLDIETGAAVLMLTQRCGLRVTLPPAAEPAAVEAPPAPEAKAAA